MISKNRRRYILFTYRYETELDECINRELFRRKKEGEKGNRSELLVTAFTAFHEAYSNGRIRPRYPSDFKFRPEKKDKVTRQIYFPAKPKKLLARLAFTFSLSQAEVLRMALEWYVRGKLQEEENYLLKWNHKPEKGFVASVFYNLCNQHIDYMYTTKPRSGTSPL